MPTRLSSHFQPSNPTLRKRIGLALQLAGTGCVILDLCLPDGPNVAGLVFTLWVFLGYQMQASAQDRERLEWVTARMTDVPQTGAACSRGEEASELLRAPGTERTHSEQREQEGVSA